MWSAHRIAKDDRLPAWLRTRCAGGATFIQLRAKDTDAKDITSMARDIAQVIEHNSKSDSVAFVIDDRVDVVWQARHKGIKVDDVHIGQTDLEPTDHKYFKTSDHK